MPALYYCYQKGSDCRIYHGEWRAGLQEVSEHLQRSTHQGLTKGGKTLEAAYAVIQSKFPEVRRENVKIFEKDASGHWAEQRLNDVMLSAPEVMDVSLSDLLNTDPTESDLLAFLRTQPADVLSQVRTAGGETLLHYATKRNFVELLSYALLACGALIHAFDESGYTALHWAYQLIFPEAARVLTAHGADHTLRTQNRQAELPLFLLPNFGLRLDTKRSEIEALTDLVPQATQRGVTVSLGNNAAGERVITRVETTPISLSGTPSMQQLAAIYPDAFQHGREYPHVLKPGLAIRHIWSQSWMGRALNTSLQGKPLAEVLRGKCFHLWMSEMTKRHQDACLAVENLFIGSAAENGRYGSLIPLVNAALDAAEPIDDAGTLRCPVGIPVRPEDVAPLRAHRALCWFMAKDGSSQLACSTLGRLKALHRAIHYDNPAYAIGETYASPLAEARSATVVSASKKRPGEGADSDASKRPCV